MPTKCKPSNKCRDAGCKTLVPGTWCREHSPKNKGRDSFYKSKRWKAEREAHLQEQPLCVCGAQFGCTHPPRECRSLDRISVDHITPLRLGGTALQTLCIHCHTRKTRAEQGLR